MTTQRLENVEIVHLGIRIWTGTKKLELSDLDRVNQSDLPSSEVATLGTKRVIDPNHLKPFSQIRHRAEEACRKVGVRFLGGFAIPETAVAELMAVFDDLKDQFESELDNFVGNYDDWVEDWALAHPDFASQIRIAQMPHDWLRSRFSAKVAVYRITASEHERDDFIEDQQNDLLESVLSAIIDELSDYVQKVLDPRTDGFRVTVRSSVADVAQKLRKFSFLDNSGGMIALASQLEHAVQGDGKIQHDDYLRFKAAISDLVSVEALKKRISSLGGGIAPQTELSEPVFSSDPSVSADFDLDLSLDLGSETAIETGALDLSLDLGSSEDAAMKESSVTPLDW